MVAAAVVMASLTAGVVSVHATSATARPAATATGDNAVIRWDQAVLTAVRTSALGPPVVARAIAIVHTCIYDAWAAYDGAANGTAFGGRLRRPVGERTLPNKTEAISFAAYRAGLDLWPDHRSLFDATMRSLGFDPALPPQDPTSPSAVGRTACDAVLARRHNDGSNQLGNVDGARAQPYSDYSGYRSSNGPMVVSNFDPESVHDPSHWQPLTYRDATGTVVTQRYVGAQWGNVQPFAPLTRTLVSSLTGPAEFPSAAYRTQAEEIVDLTANLTDTQKMIAEYWANGPRSEQPPGHWCLFGQFVSRRDQHTLDDDAKMFFVLGNAVSDAGIAAWTAKRQFDSVRPITAIRFLFHGQQLRSWAGPGLGTRLIDGDDWVPYQSATFPSPPFAENPSGHSAFSAAAAEALKSFTGSDSFGASVTLPARSSMIEPGLTPRSDVTLSWPTFTAAADEAGMSRRYGGIHFAQGDLDGRLLGRLTGAQVSLTANLYFLGLAGG
jgi:hypothetical protein